MLSPAATLLSSDPISPTLLSIHKAPSPIATSSSARTTATGCEGGCRCHRGGHGASCARPARHHRSTMPAHQIQPAAPVVPGGVAVSRRHAKLLHHLFEGNNNNAGPGVGAPVKDLRIHRVVPPAWAPPPDFSPDPPAPAVKPVPAVQIQAQAWAQSTPPEPCAAAAAEDGDRKPILLLSRSKLVRDPASFGYRRLLPFLNQMVAANNGCSDLSLCKDAPSEARASVPNKEVAGFVVGSHGGAAPVVEPVAAEAAGDRGANEEPKVAVADLATKDSCDTVSEEPKVVVSADPAISKPCVTRCARSKLVHHPSSSFSYKRMLPFLMENNEISYQEEEEEGEPD